MAKLAVEPGQAAQAATAAAAANSIARPIRRGSSASRASIQTPPARQASRARPGGISWASAQTAAAQSRRPAGSSRAAPCLAAAAIRFSLFMGPPPPLRRGRPAPPGLPSAPS